MNENDPFEDNKLDSKLIKNYIDQQMAIKMGDLEGDICDMIDNFQLEMIR